MIRTRSEIAGAARIVREAAEFGEKTGDDCMITRNQALARTAVALAWASGQDNGFIEVLEACRAIEVDGE
jgi:hypothetical protein